MSTQLVTSQIRMQQWIQIIHTRNESGLSVRDYCEQEGLSENAYYYWLRKIRESAIESAGSHFAELTAPKEPPAIEELAAGISIELNGARIRVDNSCCRSTLAMVLEVIQNAQ